MTDDMAAEGRKLRESAMLENATMRGRIVEAGSDILVQDGLGGLTFAETGRRVGLQVTGVTYYFKRRDDLAAACFEHALGRLSGLVAEAEKGDTAPERIRLFISAYVEILRGARLEKNKPIPMLSGVLTLGEEWREPLMASYREFFRRVRNLFGAAANSEKDILTARTHVLLEILFWLQNVLRHYSPDEYDRYADHLFVIVKDGLAGRSAAWEPTIWDLVMPVEPRGLRQLIRAATPLINEQGYKGASINKVVGQLNLTKGSFYHHLNSRDALTMECFSASYDTIKQAQRHGRTLTGTHWDQLTSTVASLIAFQFSASGPLLRTTALQGLPTDLRQQVVWQAENVARSFANLVTDSFVSGDSRPIDAAIAGHALSAMINGAYVMLNWSKRRPTDEAIRIYAETILFGFFPTR